MLKSGEWLAGDAWEAAAKEYDDLAFNRTREARRRLKQAGRIERVEVREGRKSRVLFAPAERIRPVAWPDPPATLREYEERGK